MDLELLLGVMWIGFIFQSVSNPKILEERLQLDCRDGDGDGDRLLSGKIELESFFRGDFDEFIDYKVVNYEKDVEGTARAVYAAYLNAL